MAVDLLSYKGDAGLGFGSNPNIPVPTGGSDSLNVVTQLARDFAAQDNQRNMMLYQQKIRDRDNTLQMIAADQIATGDILPDYLPKIEKAKEEQIKAFDSWGGNPNDIKGYTKYKEAHQKAADLAKLAQLNTLQIKKNRVDAANELIPARQKDYTDFEKRQLEKGLDNIVDPYQKNLYFNFDKLSADLLGGAIGPQAQMGTTEKTTISKTGDKIKETQTLTTSPLKSTGKPSVSVGANGMPSIYSKQPDRLVNFDQILGNATKEFIDPKGVGKENMELLVNNIEQSPYSTAKSFIDNINEKIELYNSQTIGRAGEVKKLVWGEDIKETVDPNTGEKRIHIASTTPEFAAKAVLASIPGNYFEEGATSINKDAADFYFKSEKLKRDTQLLGLNKDKANAYIENMRAKTKKLQENDADPNEVSTVANMFVDDPQLGMVVERTTRDDSGKVTGKEKVENFNAFYVDKIPSNYQNVIISTDTKGHVINKAITPFINPANGRPYLKGEIYNNFGRKVNTDAATLRKAYEEDKKAGRISTTFDSYVLGQELLQRQLLKSGTYKAILKDKSGATIDINSINDAYRDLNNRRATGKGKELLFQEDTEPENSTINEE